MRHPKEVIRFKQADPQKLQLTTFMKMAISLLNAFCLFACLDTFPKKGISGYPVF